MEYEDRNFIKTSGNFLVLSPRWFLQSEYDYTMDFDLGVQRKELWLVIFSVVKRNLCAIGWIPIACSWEKDNGLMT
ncbi:unnamed protein product [Musa acuminata subsp. burmannicoides]